MYLEWISLSNFRNYNHLYVQFPPTGIIAITGNNGQGKTNLLESISVISSNSSLQRAQNENLVKIGEESSAIRGTGFVGRRELLIEVEISKLGGKKVLLNKQKAGKMELLSSSVISVCFSPDDLELVKGGPAERRKFLDEILSFQDPVMARVLIDFERVLNQRNALLRASNGRLNKDAELTLTIWDNKMAELGITINNNRRMLCQQISPIVAEHYNSILGHLSKVTTVNLLTKSNWTSNDNSGDLLDLLQSNHEQDLRKGSSWYGPQRDEVDIFIDNFPARTHCSQGEQRTLALSMRLAAHEYLQRNGDSPPLLLLDDVFSELDSTRQARLLEGFEDTQVFVTTTDDSHLLGKATMTVEVKTGQII